MARPVEIENSTTVSCRYEREKWQKVRAKCKEKKVTPSDIMRSSLDGWISDQPSPPIITENPVFNVNVQQKEQVIDELDAEIYRLAMCGLLDDVERVKAREQTEFEHWNRDSWQSGSKTFQPSKEVKEEKKRIRDEIVKKYDKSREHLTDESRREIKDALTYLSKSKIPLESVKV